MTISILTVCFQSAATLEMTIQSVLNQDYPHIEYIVVDGASKDGTVDILKKYADRIRYISEPDRGIYDAMNKGLALATGDIIGVIGADDFYPSRDVLSTVAQTFEQNEIDAVFGDVQFVNPENIQTVVRYWKESDYHRDKWLQGWMPPHTTFYLKKSVYDQYGPYRTDFTCSADYELMLRILFKNHVSAKYIPKVLMTMRNGGTSTASWKHRWVANQEDRKAWKINQLRPRWYTLWWKPLSKIKQLFQYSGE